MGAWGTKTFDNDDALDWITDLIHDEDTDIIEVVFGNVLNSDYVDLTDGAQALAAAEVVAALNGSRVTDLPDELLEWINKEDRLDNNYVILSIKVIDKIISGESEINELWLETDEYEDWLYHVKDLKNRLNEMLS